MVGVEQWAEMRREHFVAGKSIKEIARATGLSRNTVRRALRAESPPGYRRAPKERVLDPFKEEIHRLLQEDPKLPGVRVRELLGCMVGKTAVDDYLRVVRPLFAPPPRTFQRTVYRPGELCQFDVWQPRQEVPVGHGQTRPGWVVVACLGYSRAARESWSSARRPRICWPGSPAASFGSARCRRPWSGIGRPGSTVTPAARRTRSPPSAAGSGSAGTSASGRSAGQGRGRASAGLRGDALRAGSSVREGLPDEVCVVVAIDQDSDWRRRPRRRPITMSSMQSKRRPTVGAETDPQLPEGGRRPPRRAAARGRPG